MVCSAFIELQGTEASFALIPHAHCNLKPASQPGPALRGQEDAPRRVTSGRALLGGPGPELLPQEQSQDDWQHLLQKAIGGWGVGGLGGSGRAELAQWGNECVYSAAGEEY